MSGSSITQVFAAKYSPSGNIDWVRQAYGNGPVYYAGPEKGVVATTNNGIPFIAMPFARTMSLEGDTITSVDGALLMSKIVSTK